MCTVQTNNYHTEVPSPVLDSSQPLKCLNNECYYLKSGSCSNEKNCVFKSNECPEVSLHYSYEIDSCGGYASNEPNTSLSPASGEYEFWPPYPNFIEKRVQNPFFQSYHQTQSFQDSYLNTKVQPYQNHDIVQKFQTASSHIPNHIPNQSPGCFKTQPWDYNLCYGGDGVDACRYGNVVDIEDIM